MTQYRPIIALALVFAIFAIPLGVSWAADHRAAGAPYVSGGSAIAPCDNASARGEAAACPCEKAERDCPPEFCAAKCFQSIGCIAPTDITQRISSLDLRPEEPSRLSAWQLGLHYPPPRA